MLNTARRSVTTLHRAATVAASVSILLAAATQMSISDSAEATGHAASKCHVVVSGAPWSIREAGGRLSGSRYTILADGSLCSAARRWVVKFTHQKGNGLGETLHGPGGFKCHSLSTAASGDTLVYTGVCGHGIGYKPPAFGWAPEIKR